jgi:hypothetical protein
MFRDILFCLYSFLLVFKLSGQPNNVEESALIHPEILIGNAEFILAEFVKSCGYHYTNEKTVDDIKFMHIKTKTYDLAIYFRDDTTVLARILSSLKKTQRWKKYYSDLVKKYPKAWSKLSDYQYKFNNEETSTILYVDIMRDIAKELVIVEIHP